MKLLRWDTREVIFELECDSISDLVRGALKVKISMYRANLSGADLRGADLCDAIGNKRELRTLQVDTYSISFTKEIMQIGCKRFTIEEWKNFKDSEIRLMDTNSLTWWKIWKEFIFKAIELSFKDEKCQ